MALVLFQNRHSERSIDGNLDNEITLSLTAQKAHWDKPSGADIIGKVCVHEQLGHQAHGSNLGLCT